jgi:hypothetical protein
MLARVPTRVIFILLTLSPDIACSGQMQRRGKARAKSNSNCLDYLLLHLQQESNEHWHLRINCACDTFTYREIHIDQRIRKPLSGATQSIPVEKPTEHTSGRSETAAETKRKNSRLSTKMTSMPRAEQAPERSEDGVIEKVKDLGDDETSLSFPPFW